VKLRFPDELQASAEETSQTTIESSTFLPIPQLGEAALEDLVTYLIVTAEV